MSNVPKLRFKEFSGEWEVKKYGDIYSFYSTNSLSRDKLNYESGSVKNIHYGDIHTKFNTMFNIQNEDVPFVNNEVDLSKIKNESYCLIGDLVIADASEDYNDIGKTIEITNLNNEKVIAGLHTFLARPNKFDTALGFVGYLVQSWNVRKQVMIIAQGTKVLSISTGRLSKIKLNLPSKQEQKKIASFLTSIHNKIEQLTKKESLLQDYKKGVMQKIFNQEIRFKNFNGKNFSEWKEYSLKNLLVEAKEKSTINNEFNVLSSTKNNIVLQSEYFNKEIASSDNSGYKILKLNQLVFSPQNLWLGNINVNTKYDIGIVSPSYKVFNFNPIINVTYAKYFLKNPRMMYEYAQASEQGASVVRRSLNIDLFNSIKCLLPCLEEQEKIANFLSSIDKKIEVTKIELEKTKEFKKALLQQMFV